MVDAIAEKTTGAENIIWDLSIFYDDIQDPRIQEDMQKLETQVDQFVKTYKGKIASLNAQEIVNMVKNYEQLFDLSGRIQSFGRLLYTTDTNNPQYGAFVQKLSEFDAKIDQKLVFVSLEWNALEDEAVEAILADPAVTEYRYFLEADRRFKPYKLSEVEEQLLLEKSVTGRNAWTRLFSQIMSAMRYEFDDEQLTQTQILNKLFDSDREVRKKAAKGLTKGLQERSMELNYIFNTLAADKASDDRTRKYESWISSRNLSNKAPDSVVEALVETVTSSYDLVARHYELKRILLGYDELVDYDRYAPLDIDAPEKFYSWDEGKEIVLDAFEAFSPWLAEVSQKFFDENWIHAPTMPGKRGGAYASPTVPSAHPFVFVNYMGKVKDIMTLAHELGHGMHMYLSGEEGNLFKLYTPLTTAEMASTFGEMLVFQDLMDNEIDKEVQLAMMIEKVEDTFGTVFRQIAMNRFEDAMHTTRRNEGEITVDRMNELWTESQRAMYGDSITISEDYGYWWSYVPHFLHTPGYVYAYSFGELLVLALYKKYQAEGDSFVPKYVDLLAAGDSDYPDKLLAKMGLDLNDSNFWQLGIDVIAEMIEQEEQLARELYPEKF